MDMALRWLGGVVVLLAAVLLLALVARASRRRARVVAPVVVPQPKPTLEDVRSLARVGRKLDAIRLFRELTGQGLVEARAAVEQLSGKPAVAARRPGIILREVNDADIESQIRAGHLFNAVALYREKNGVGLQEARAAVERWRHRLQAS